MATREVHICDRCESYVEAVYDIEIRVTMVISPYASEDFPTREVCQGCIEDLRKQIKADITDAEIDKALFAGMEKGLKNG